MVQNADIKEDLAANVMLGVGNQFRARDCSALAVFLADLEAGKRINRIQQLEKEWGKRHPSYLAVMPLSTSFLLGEGHVATWLKRMTTDVLSEMQPMPEVDPIRAWSYKNTSLLVQSYVLAAASHDLATCIMEGFDSRRAKEVLRIPDRYSIPMMVATGYDYDEARNEKDSLTPRLPMEDVVFGDCFGRPFYEGEEDEPKAAEA